MSFAQLEEAILTEAKQRIGSIRDQYEEQYRQEEKRVTTKARELEEEIIDQAQEDAKMEAGRRHQTTQLKAKADILTAKQEELQQAREAVVQELLAWDAANVSRLVTGLMKLIPDNEGAEITAGEKHVEAIKQAAKAKGIQVAEKYIPNEGGFVYRDETAEFNLTVRHLVDQLFASHRTDIAKILFS